MPSEVPTPSAATRSASRPATALRDLSHRFFIEGLTGMAHGLFATLIIGTILSQAGAFLPGAAGDVAVILGRVAAAITGAGIGLGVAHRLKADTFVVISAAVAGRGALRTVVDGAGASTGTGTPRAERTERAEGGEGDERPAPKCHDTRRIACRTATRN